MKKKVCFSLCVLILLSITLCSCVKQPDQICVYPTSQPTSTEVVVTQTSTQNIKPTETQVATQEVRTPFAMFSVISDSYKEDIAPYTIFASKDLKAHFPVKENGYWDIRDRFGNITHIKQTGIDSNTVSFTIQHVGAKAYRVTVALGAFVWLQFQDFKNLWMESLYYDPTGDQFVVCDYGKLLPCIAPPSAVFFNIRETGKISKSYDETDKLWCTNLDNYYILRLANVPQDDPMATATAYRFPGSDKIINWVTECPTVKIEELT
jgi:hypothetical protein